MMIHLYVLSFVFKTIFLSHPHELISLFFRYTHSISTWWYLYFFYFLFLRKSLDTLAPSRPDDTFILSFVFKDNFSFLFSYSLELISLFFWHTHSISTWWYLYYIIYYISLDTLALSQHGQNGNIVYLCYLAIHLNSWDEYDKLLKM